MLYVNTTHDPGVAKKLIITVRPAGLRNMISNQTPFDFIDASLYKAGLDQAISGYLFTLPQITTHRPLTFLAMSQSESARHPTKERPYFPSF